MLTSVMISLYVADKVLVSQRIVKCTDAIRGSLGHEPAEAGDRETCQNCGDCKGQRLHAGTLRQVLADEVEQSSCDGSSKYVCLANNIGPVREVAVLHQDRKSVV